MNNMNNINTTIAGFLTLGLTIASFLVKNPDTKAVLMGLATAMASGGLVAARDAGGNTSTNRTIVTTIPVEPVMPVVPATTPTALTTSVATTVPPLAVPQVAQVAQTIDMREGGRTPLDH